MLVSAPESAITTLAECHEYRSYLTAIVKLREYDAMRAEYRCTFTRFGAYWYIHAYNLAAPAKLFPNIVKDL
jgi:hypothetical protein